MSNSANPSASAAGSTPASSPPSPAAGSRPRPAPAGTQPAPPCSLVFFGAAGDLSKRLLMPSLYNLSAAGLLDAQMKIIGVNRGDEQTSAWRDALHDALRQFAADKASTFHTAHLDEAVWERLAQRLEYMAGEFTDDAAYTQLKQKLADTPGGNVVFYLAVGAQFFRPIVEHLGKAGLLKEGDGAGGFRRIVIEKPFGTDLASARDLNAHLLRYVTESQIYRIDHFLGKDTVQSMLAMRFANALFEPVWRREYIECVQITASETIGVEGRGKFYEQTGAFRDMVPNHLFQLLGMIAMEPPNSFDAEAVRDRKADLFEAIQPLGPGDVVLGQYARGPAGPAYRDEPDVSATSRTETYAAARVFVENWRWAGVPFYLRTGKRLAARRTEVSVYLKAAPLQIFRDTPVDTLKHNVLTLRVDPSHGTSFAFNVKMPGPVMQVSPVQAAFDYDDFFSQRPNVGYETLLYDCMLGDQTLFQRADSIETSWAAVDAVLHPRGGEVPVRDYAAGSAGPAEADALLAQDGHAWTSLDKPPAENK